jgi:hypothetical protein
MAILKDLTDGQMMTRGFRQVLCLPPDYGYPTLPGPRVDVTGNALIDSITTNWSIALFWRAWEGPGNSAGPAYGVMFSYHAVANSNIVVKTATSSNARYRVNTANGVGTVTNVNSTSTAPASRRWIHSVVTWDGTTVRLYTNGLADGTGALTGTMAFIASDPVQFGAATVGGTNNDNFPGLMAGIRFYKGTLSAADIRSLYMGGLTGQEANIIGSWPGIGSGRTLADVSGKNNPGTLFNGARFWSLRRRP